MVGIHRRLVTNLWVISHGDLCAQFSVWSNDRPYGATFPAIRRRPTTYRQLTLTVSGIRSKHFRPARILSLHMTTCAGNLAGSVHGYSQRHDVLRRLTAFHFADFTRNINFTRSGLAWDESLIVRLILRVYYDVGIFEAAFFSIICTSKWPTLLTTLNFTGLLCNLFASFVFRSRFLTSSIRMSIRQT